MFFIYSSVSSLIWTYFLIDNLSSTRPGFKSLSDRLCILLTPVLEDQTFVQDRVHYYEVNFHFVRIILLVSPLLFKTREGYL